MVFGVDVHCLLRPVWPNTSGKNKVYRKNRSVVCGLEVTALDFRSQGVGV